uniref:Protein kinase domain-containing protein n=1 Tax=Aegilops tauschii subsp. strangulata TaxID=200361 RepID=A0A453Q949_AEGTS
MPSKPTNHKAFVVLEVVTHVVIIVSVAMVILVLLSWGEQKRKSLLLPSFGRQFPKVSFNDITRATQGFATSSIIGRGRYGSVYQGKLFQDGSDVAIKVFSLETRGSQKSFIAECNALRNVCHRNLVPILTACSSIDSNGNDFKALVYEFMPGGDLHRLLYSTQDDEGSSECATGAHVSTASNVYSFGIVLLEIFLRKRPTDDMFKDGLDIAKFVEVHYSSKVSQIVDPELLQDEAEFPNGSPLAMKRQRT